MEAMEEVMAPVGNGKLFGLPLKSMDLSVGVSPAKFEEDYFFKVESV
jgi:hypothetical protein